MDQVESTTDLDLGASSRTTEELFQDLYSELRRTQASIDNLEEPRDDAVDHLILDDHLARLARLHPEKARILELRFFAGLTMAQIAALTGQSEKTIQRHWAYARAWLYESIQRENGG
jgi:RNA polymerase sigma factor (sigma-70 family)